MANYIFPTLPAQLQVGDTVRFNYTGAVQTLSTNRITKAKFEVWGAAGGNAGGYVGGKGGYASGQLSFSAAALYVYVGGRGKDFNSGDMNSGGWNGGSGSHAYNIAGGGGGTDIRIGNTSFADRIIVAGGGSGAVANGGGGNVNGAVGGGLVGGNGTQQVNATGGTGGTQTAGGTGGRGLSAGGSQYSNGSFGYANGYGAGGGWYGGGSGALDPNAGVSTGGGGSGYVSASLSSTQILDGAQSFPAPSGGLETGHSGDGVVVITILEVKEGSDYVYPSLPAQFKRGDTVRFNYTGAVQSVTVPAGVTQLSIQCFGAAGRSPSGTTQGKGGYAAGELVVAQGDVLNIYVGGQGKDVTNGSNPGLGSNAAAGDSVTGKGGGGTDIRLNGTALADRIIVAGGGGGGVDGKGGDGGGLMGNHATYNYSNYHGKGGAQGGGGGGSTNPSSGAGGSAGSFGIGGNAWYPDGKYYGGGGGGGYYGGGGGSQQAGGAMGGGGGGSSYASGYPGCSTHSSGRKFEKYSLLTGAGSISDGYVIITVGFDIVPMEYTPTTLPATYKVGDVIRFNYVGASSQAFTIPSTVKKIKIECWGAQGGPYGGAYGGYTSGELDVSSISSLYMFVGENPTGTAGGWNGGGNSNTYNGVQGGGGGGGTDVRLVNGAWNNATSLASRIMVAGAGGGQRSNKNQDGYGGGLTGGTNADVNYDGYGGYGGTQSAGGAAAATWSGALAPSPGGLGYGGDGSRSGSMGWGGGGGGGYYGGGGGSGATSGSWGGGGGSSYISGLAGCAAHSSGKLFTNASTTANISFGNGSILVTVLETNLSIPVKINSKWYNGDISVKINDVWKTGIGIWIKENGTWKLSEKSTT